MWPIVSLLIRITVRLVSLFFLSFFSAFFKIPTLFFVGDNSQEI